MVLRLLTLYRMAITNLQKYIIYLIDMIFLTQKLKPVGHG